MAFIKEENCPARIGWCQKKGASWLKQWTHIWGKEFCVYWTLDKETYRCCSELPRDQDNALRPPNSMSEVVKYLGRWLGGNTQGLLWRRWVLQLKPGSLTSKRVTGEEDSTKEIKKTRSEQLDKKEFLEVGVYSCQMLQGRQERKRSGNVSCIRTKEKEWVLVAGPRSLAVRSQDEGGIWGQERGRVEMRDSRACQSMDDFFKLQYIEIQPSLPSCTGVAWFLLLGTTASEAWLALESEFAPICVWK